MSASPPRSQLLSTAFSDPVCWSSTKNKECLDYLQQGSGSNVLNQGPILRQVVKSKNRSRFLDEDAKSRELTTTWRGGGQLKGLLSLFVFMSNFGTYSSIQNFVKNRDLIRFTS